MCHLLAEASDFTQISVMSLFLGPCGQGPCSLQYIPPGLAQQVLRELCCMGCWRGGHPDTYLGREHVQDAIDGPSKQQSPDQEAGQHHVGEEGAEIHHLWRRQGPTVGQGPSRSWHFPPCSQLGHMSLL